MTIADQPKPKKKWPFWKVALAVLAGLFALGLLANLFGEPAPPTTQAAMVGTSGQAAAEASPDAASTAEAVDVEEPVRLTGPQRNAVRSAKQYLSFKGFSRDGLIEQLSSDAGDGYEVADATAAVDSLTVDWNENAARSAQDYLNMTGFSCEGLKEQLSSDAGDKYTAEQAAYGAQKAGAC